MKAKFNLLCGRVREFVAKIVGFVRRGNRAAGSATSTSSPAAS